MRDQCTRAMLLCFGDRQELAKANGNGRPIVKHTLSTHVLEHRG
jgi:hypothetical protein